MEPCQPAGERLARFQKCNVNLALYMALLFLLCAEPKDCRAGIVPVCAVAELAMAIGYICMVFSTNLAQLTLAYAANSLMFNLLNTGK